MKKIIFLFLTVALMSCSKDEPVEQRESFKDEIEILSHEWKKIETSGDMVKVSMNAKIKNETKEDVRGRIIFIRHGSLTDLSDPTIILYSDVFEIKKGETVNFSQDMPDLIKSSIFNGGYDEFVFEYEENIQG